MNALPIPLSRSAIALIQADHSMVTALFRKLQPGTPPAVREALARRICTALDIHARVEEEVFYPALHAARVESPALDKSGAEHEQIRLLIGRVRSLAGQPDAQERALCDLLNAVLHHVADEESIVLPAAARTIPHERLTELGREMHARRLTLTRAHAGELAADAVRSAPARSMLAATAMLLGAAWMLGRSRHHMERLAER